MHLPEPELFRMLPALLLDAEFRERVRRGLDETVLGNLKLI